MPTIDQKKAILKRAGMHIPGCPCDAACDEAITAWHKSVDDMFTAYVMARAARSLREAEEAQQLGHLRNANAQMGQDDPGPA